MPVSAVAELAKAQKSSQVVTVAVAGGAMTDWGWPPHCQVLGNPMASANGVKVCCNPCISGCLRFQRDSSSAGTDPRNDPSRFPGDDGEISPWSSIPRMFTV